VRISLSEGFIRPVTRRLLHGGRLKRADLARHDVIGWEGALGQIPPLNWIEGQGGRQFTFRANSYHSIVEAALGGQGMAVLSEASGRDLPELVRIEVSDVELPEVAIYLAYHREVRRVPRVRLVIDALMALGREALRSRS
jgi:DNA-binding transcriptional LysR family regulator